MDPGLWYAKAVTLFTLAGHTRKYPSVVDGGLKDELSHIKDIVAAEGITRYPWKLRDS